MVPFAVRKEEVKSKVMKRGNSKRRRGGQPNQTGKPSWIWTRKGAIQLIGMNFDGKPKLGVPVFMTYEDARAFIDTAQWDDGTRPAEIGTVVVDGRVETLEGILLAHAVKNEIGFMAIGRRVNGKNAWQIFSGS